MNSALSALPRFEAAPAWVKLSVDAVLMSYSQVIFSRSRLAGVLLLLATMTVPDVGLIGLFGVLASNAIATLLQFDREAVRTGVLGYNALLVFLAIGATLDRSPAFWVLAGVLVFVTVLVHVSLSGVLTYHFKLPALSLPFVIVAWLSAAIAPHVRGMGFIGHPPALDLGAFPGPEIIDSLLRSLGALFFQPHWSAGLLVLIALALYSRIAVVHALLGFAVAVFSDTY